MTARDTHLKCFILSGGEAHDAPMDTAGKQEQVVPLLMDRAYGDFKTQFTAGDLGFKTVVPPKSNTADKREYDKEWYKKGNERERYFRRIKAFRVIFTR